MYRTDTVDKIMRYEQGEMSQDEVVEFFQELVDSGLAWQLQGHYGRQARCLIEAGLVQVPHETRDGHAVQGNGGIRR